MRHLEVEVTNVDELLATEAYGAGALLRWERAATETGTYVEGGTEALLAGVTLYDVWDSAGTETTWYRTRVSNAGGTTFSAYSAPRSPVTSVTSLAEVRALVTTSLSDVDLQAVIDREEAALARVIGPLAGERTQTWYVGDQSGPDATWSASTGARVASDRMAPLALSRPTASVELVDNGVAVDPADVRLLRGGTAVERASGGWTGPIVTATYTPDDQAEVVRVVIGLCRLTLSETAYQSETIGDYSYTKDSPTSRSAGDPRKALIRSLQTHAARGSVGVRTSSDSPRVGAVVTP